MAGPETFSWWKGSRVAAEPSTTDTASSNRTSERIAAHHGGATADRKPGAQEPGKGTAFPLMASAASGGGTAAPPPDSPAQGLLEHIEALIGRQLYFQAIDAYLQLDTPAMHWEQDFQGKGLPQTPTTIPQGYRHLRLELLDWCMQSLQRLQDARTSAVEVSSLQEQAAGARDAAVLEQGAVWQTSFDTDPKNQLSGAIWHLSETREEAWNNLVAVFRDEAVMAADPRQFNQQGVQQVSVAGILRLASRRHSIPPRLTHRPSQDGKSRHRQALPADAVDTSKPYVQAVGDRLLKSARQQLPLMRGLAEDVPKDVITRLYGGPLATAVRKHLEWQLAHKPASAAAKLEDNVVRRSKCFPFPFPLWTTSAKQETDQAASDEEPGIVAAHLVLAVGEAHQAVISFLQELHELMIQLGCSSDANYEGAVDTDWDGIVYETVIKAFRSMQDPFHSEIASCLQAFVSTILQHVPAEQARQASIGPGTISRAKFLGSVTTDKASFAQMGIPSDTHKRMSDITRSDGPASRNNREVSHTPMSRPSLEAAAKRSMEITRNRSKSLDVASQALLDGPTTRSNRQTASSEAQLAAVAEASQASGASGAWLDIQAQAAAEVTSPNERSAQPAISAITPNKPDFASTWSRAHQGGLALPEEGDLDEEDVPGSASSAECSPCAVDAFESQFKSSSRDASPIGSCASSPTAKTSSPRKRGLGVTWGQLKVAEIDDDTPAAVQSPHSALGWGKHAGHANFDSMAVPITPRRAAGLSLSAWGRHAADDMFDGTPSAQPPGKSPSLAMTWGRQHAAALAGSPASSISGRASPGMASIPTTPFRQGSMTLGCMTPKSGGLAMTWRRPVDPDGVVTLEQHLKCFSPHKAGPKTPASTKSALACMGSVPLCPGPAVGNGNVNSTPLENAASLEPARSSELETQPDEPVILRMSAATLTKLHSGLSGPASGQQAAPLPGCLPDTPAALETVGEQEQQQPQCNQQDDSGQPDASASSTVSQQDGAMSGAGGAAGADAAPVQPNADGSSEKQTEPSGGGLDEKDRLDLEMQTHFVEPGQHGLQPQPAAAAAAAAVSPRANDVVPMAYWDQPVNSRQLAGKRDNPQRSTQSPNAQGERGSIDRLQQLASTASSATSRATDVVPMACWDQPVYSRHLPEDKQDRTDLDMQAHFPPHAQHGFHPPPAEGTRPMSVVPPSYWNKPAASTQPAMQRKNTQSSVQTPSAQTPKAPSASAAKPAGVQEAPKAAPFVPPKGMPVVCWAPSGPDSMDVEQARPQLVDANCQRVLRYVIYQQEQISLWPPAVVTSLVQLLLMVLQTVMDHLEAAGSLAYSNAASEACFLYLSAGLCTQHCLETLPVNDDVLTSCQEADREAILQAVGDCRAQATSLVDNLADRAVRLHMDALYSVILAEINSLPWRAYRTAMCHSTGPGYAVRLWRLMLHSTLHGLCQVCPLTSAVGLFAETLLRQLKVLASAYLKLAPSQQWLPRYVADVAYVVATVFSFAESGSSGQGTVQTALSQICRRMCMHAGLLCTSAEALAALVTATTPPTVFGAPSGWAWLDPEDILRLSARLPDLACPFRPLAAADVSDDWEARLGASWRALVAHMAGQASREQALTALAFRHELLAEIPGLTYSPEQLQARRLLAQLASQQPQLVRTATLPA